MKKGLNIEVTTGQYQLLYNLICDAYDRGYDQRPSIDTQTFDNLFDNVCRSKGYKQSTHVSSEVSNLLKKKLF